MRFAVKNARWWRDESPTNLLVENERVVYRGCEGIDAEEVVDAQGRYLMPAFVEAHAHILASGMDMMRLDLSPFTSRDEVLAAVRERAHRVPEGDWLQVTHYDSSKFADGKEISLDELDAATNGVPTILRQSSGHACLVNRAVLRIGLIESANDPPGGSIVRDERGGATGILNENAMGLAYRHAPKPDRHTMRDAIVLAAKQMRSLGICAAADMQTGSINFEDELWAYRAASEECPKMRFRLYLDWKAVFVKKAPLKAVAQDEGLRIAGIKIFADGAIGPGTAAIYGEFETGGDGQLIYSPEELSRKVLAADDAGFAVAVHSIGDRSTDHVIESFSKTTDPSRHRIEHAMMLSDDQIRRIKRLGIRVVAQPAFLSAFGAAYVRRLGTRAGTLKRLKSLVDMGVPLVLSSDSPIVPFDPWIGIKNACRRPDSFDQNENISVEDAINAYTQGGADALADGALYGSLLPGQYADYQLLEESPRERIQ